ncbi:unnamed protein product [Urochloa humidicola]
MKDKTVRRRLAVLSVCLPQHNMLMPENVTFTMLIKVLYLDSLQIGVRRISMKGCHVTAWITKFVITRLPNGTLVHYRDMCPRNDCWYMCNHKAGSSSTNSGIGLNLKIKELDVHECSTFVFYFSLQNVSASRRRSRK